MLTPTVLGLVCFGQIAAAWTVPILASHAAGGVLLKPVWLVHQAGADASGSGTGNNFSGDLS